MTLQSWKDEFYPKEPTKRMSKRKAVEHSLRKWQGLTRANLKKHGCFVHSDSVGFENDDGTFDWFIVDADSCALCHVYIDYGAEVGLVCAKCPLAQSLGKPCDYGNNSPYMRFVDYKHNPYPMIRALRKLLDE